MSGRDKYKALGSDYELEKALGSEYEMKKREALGSDYELKFDGKHVLWDGLIQFRAEF